MADETESSELVKVHVDKTFTYRGKQFEADKVYEVDPNLIPGWVERWIVSMGNGRVVAADEDVGEWEPDPRTVQATGSSAEEQVEEEKTTTADQETGEEAISKERVKTARKEALQQAVGVHEGMQGKVTLPHPGSESNLGDLPLEGTRPVGTLRQQREKVRDQQESPAEIEQGTVDPARARPTEELPQEPTDDESGFEKRPVLTGTRDEPVRVTTSSDVPSAMGGTKGEKTAGKKIQK